jgi:CheY-like chemotaxis protein
LHRTEEVLGVASRRQDNNGFELVGQRESRALTSERTQEEQPAVREAPLELVMSESASAAKVVQVSPPKVKPPSSALIAGVKSSAAERTPLTDSSTPAKVAPERIISINPPSAPLAAKPPAAVAPQLATEARPKESEALLSEIPILFTSEEMERYEEPAAPAKAVTEVPAGLAPPVRVAPPVSVITPPAPPTVLVKPPVISPPAVAPISPSVPAVQPHTPMPSLSELTAQPQTARPASAPLSTTLSDNRPKTASKDLPLRVLLVEDEPVSQLVTQSQLGQLGHECTVASDSHEAIRLYQQQPFDAVISSYLMPGMNGIELCRKIRDDARGGYTYFILLTAVERKDEAAKALEAGVDAFLTKPLDPNELAIRLKVARGVQSRLNRVYSELPDQRG